MVTPRGTQGFTLLELMIVLVIVGILAIIAVPRFTGVSVQAKQAEAEPLLKQLCQFAEMDRQRNGSWPDPMPSGWVNPNAKYFTFSFTQATGTAAAIPDPAHAGLVNRSMDCTTGDII
jgi:prepilin-type N-terminal cleavage/methylation domain-containing protein